MAVRRSGRGMGGREKGASERHTSEPMVEAFKEMDGSGKIQELEMRRDDESKWGWKRERRRGRELGGEIITLRQKVPGTSTHARIPRLGSGTGVLGHRALNLFLNAFA